MIERAGSGWQTILADLSLILFMVAVSALNNAPKRVGVAAPSAAKPSEQAEPLGIWREAPGMPSLGQWLAEQAVDSRQQLTILVQYRQGGQSAAANHGAALAAQAEQTGASARIVVEPGDGSTTARLAFDVPQARLAQQLLGPGKTPGPAKEAP